jgi:predicted HAD superfamily Cof-like phosphohydrolase
MTTPSPDYRGLIERAAYRVGNPSAWEAYDDAASEDICALIAAIRDLEADNASLRRARQTDKERLGQYERGFADLEADRERKDATNLDRVREFHETFGVPVMARPCIPADRVTLRLDILDEERRELTTALEAGDVVEVADALTDMAYLIYGTALEFGIDLNACFAEVHRSNMSKLGADGKPIYRDDGKVLKGPNYSPPDLRQALSRLDSPNG